MKKISKIIISIVIILGLSACNEEFLELTPITYANESDFFKTNSDFETAITSIYGRMGDSFVMLPWNMEFRGDNLKFWNYIGMELSTNQLNPNAGSFIWSMYSSLVFPTNNILEKLEKAEEVTEAVKKTVSGEALFFRGYAYYWFYLGFGRVPLITSVITSDEAMEIGLSSEEEILAQAIADFEKAAGLLPATSPVFGKLDKFDAMSFHAKALMLKNSWNKAATVLQDVYNNSGHKLEPVWTDMWTTKAEKTSKEFMFQKIYSDLSAAPGANFLYIPGDPTTQNQFEYKPGLWNSFEKGDIRRDATLGFYNDGLAMNNKYDFGKVGNLWTFDVQIIRFTDVQLLYAEAISMAAGSAQQQSLNLINEVRNRAGLGNITMKDVPNLNAFVEVVLNERRHEFVFEGQRYPDLKRHHLLVQKLNAIGYNFDESYNYLPITQTEKDKVPKGLYN